ncbi:YutD family protein [Priestia taiwanensis]|nr:YutD family protein [Priestia taiwanensis]
MEVSRGEKMITINNVSYELVRDYREGFNEEAFKARYAEILNKYDYIVGDWGYSQLRLRGFFEDGNQRASHDTKISTLSEYLYEFCNFGCPYFVVKKVKNVENKNQKDS